MRTAICQQASLRMMALAAVLLLTGGPTRGEATPSPTEAVTPKMAVCAVCGVREKAGPEPVAATWVYQGRTYFFCQQACKEEFRLDPEKWIRAAAQAENHPGPEAKPASPSRPGAAAVPT